MSKDQWTDLENLAKAATPGPWHPVGSTMVATDDIVRVCEANHRLKYNNNHFIAAAHPQTILNLIALARSEAVLREALQIAGEGLRWGHRLAHFDAESLQVKAIRTVSKALAESDKLRSGK